MRLIKTPIELLKTRSTDNDVLLGSWCIQEGLISQRKNLDIVPYHWNDREKYNADYSFLTSLYEETLTKLSKLLNEIHNLNENVNYWRIIIGPWLRFFIDAIFDRYQCIKLAKKYGDFNACNIFSYDLDNWIVTNFGEFYADLISDEWNEVIFSECIKFQGLPFVQTDCLHVSPSREVKKKVKFNTHFKHWAKKLITTYSHFLTKHKKSIVFFAPYMPIAKYLKLNLKLQQMPYSIDGIVIPTEFPRCHQMRFRLIQSNGGQTFEDFLSHQIANFIPKIYLENFMSTRSKVLKFLPSKPNAIFTSVGYQSDDIFKIWAAEQKKNGTPLFINQHGGHMGIGKINQTLDHQLSIASNFFSWGWAEETTSQVVKLPSLQLSGLRDVRQVRDGDILHILSSLPRYFYCHSSIPVGGQFLSYLDDQLEFFGSLSSSSIANLRIRLATANQPGYWDLNRYFSLEGYSKYVDQSNRNLWSLIENSRLCVCTHNATVFLQTLSRNFPTIVFWDKNFYEINPEAQPFIDLLADAKILFYSPHEAAAQVNSIADNVGDWWFSDQVQLARRLFCKNYAVTSINWQKEWADFLLNTRRFDEIF